MRIRLDRLPKIDLSGLWRIFRHFGGHLRAHRLRLILSMVSLLGVSFTALLRPWPLKIIFDYILMPGKTSPTGSLFAPLANWDANWILAAAAGFVLVLAAVGGLLNYNHNVMSKVVGHRLVASMRMQLFAHVQRLPLSYHDYRETGELMTRMTGDIGLVQDMMVSTFITFASHLLLVIGMLGIMFWLDWQLALVVVLLMPFFVLAAIRYSGRIKSSARRQRETYGKIVATVQESLSGITQVKSFTQEREREKAIGKSMDRDVKANVKTTKLTANYARVVELIAAVGTGLVLWLGVRKVLDGLISAGDLLIFLSYLRSVYRPLKGMARLSTKVAKAVVRGDKLVALLDMQTEVSGEEIGRPASGIKGDIRFENICFSYVAGQEVLHDLTCRLPQQKTTLVVGPTGAGKSTLAKLILRLYTPDSGRLLVDNCEIGEYKLRSFRKRITTLSQETFLFRMSIRDNIAFAKRRAKPEQVEQAARLAGAEEFILKLPQGYDTMVGEGGSTLSGGQRQRLCFARAILRESPVMIFDEPATGLDVHAEKEAKEFLRSLHAKRTLVVITHRLHFLDLADWVVFIRDGRVVQEGTPEELTTKHDEFRQFISTDAAPSDTGATFDDILRPGVSKS